MTIQNDIYTTKPSSTIIYIDPAMARRVLAKNTRNRELSELSVAHLMREMTSGRWLYNGEAIKWAIDGTLLDGQHRLVALSRMPDDFAAIPFLIVRGLPIESQNTMDQGRKRSAGDQLKIDGLASTSPTSVAAAIRVYIQWVEGRIFGDKSTSDIGNTEVVDWAMNNPTELAMISDIIAGQTKSIKARPAVTVAVMLMLRQIDGVDQREFAEALISGAGLDAGSPILALRERLDRIKQSRVRVSDRDLIGLFVVAWNAYRDGRLLRKLQRPTNGWTRDTFPEPK